MDEDISYKLIQSVKPIKNTIPINEKFAKLTLSSNKKREHIERKSVLCGKSVSRNLIDVLNNEMESSSTNASSTQVMHNESINIDMEPLHVSTDEEQTTMTENIDVISKKVSDITLASNTNQDLQESINITLSTEDGNETPITISDVTGSSSEDSFETTIGEPSEKLVSACNNVTPCKVEKETNELMTLFLRDVSAEQRRRQNILSSSSVVSTETDINLNPIVSKEKLLSMADTESMTTSSGRHTYIKEQEIGPIAQQDTIMNTFSNFSLNKITGNNIGDVEAEEPKSNLAQQDTVLNSISSSYMLDNDATKLTLPEIEIDKTNPLSSRDTVLNTFSESVAEDFKQNSNANEIQESPELSKNESLKEVSTIISGFNTTQNSDINKSRFSTTPSINRSVREDSIVISETSSEQIDNTKEFNSTGDSDLSAIVNSVNISAKINLRIQIKQPIMVEQENSILESDNSQNTDKSNNENDADEKESESNTENSNKRKSNENIENTSGSNQTPNIYIEESEAYNFRNKEKEIIIEEFVLENEKFTRKSAVALEINVATPIQNEKHFISDAEKVLTEVYGHEWRTPQVLRSLKKVEKSIETTNINGKSAKNKSSIKKNNDKIDGANSTEESVLHDFSTCK